MYSVANQSPGPNSLSLFINARRLPVITHALVAQQHLRVANTAAGGSKERPPPHFQLRALETGTRPPGGGVRARRAGPPRRPQQSVQKKRTHGAPRRVRHPHGDRHRHTTSGCFRSFRRGPTASGQVTEITSSVKASVERTSTKLQIAGGRGHSVSCRREVHFFFNVLRTTRLATRPTRSPARPPSEKMKHAATWNHCRGWRRSRRDVWRLWQDCGHRRGLLLQTRCGFVVGRNAQRHGAAAYSSAGWSTMA